MTARDKINAWRAEHPDGTQTECIAAGVASQASVYRYWPAGQERKDKKSEGDGKRMAEKSERMTFSLPAERRKQLKVMCAYDDVNVSEWIANIVAQEWKRRNEK